MRKTTKSLPKTTVKTPSRVHGCHEGGHEKIQNGKVKSRRRPKQPTESPKRVWTVIGEHERGDAEEEGASGGRKNRVYFDR
ncbi:hypothetical protein NQ318_010271 [Aromia moschata]|uniref:Uncharacterized protein n=1 Tax=Aromia moschata TaxID=1265417 RepID=A0AAV8YJ12_9CUCU|nr:hypothetical protein NQ318_010271 [Aromia moschata]